MDLQGPPWDLPREREYALAYVAQQIGRCNDYLETLQNLWRRRRMTTEQYVRERMEMRRQRLEYLAMREEILGVKEQPSCQT